MLLCMHMHSHVAIHACTCCYTCMQMHSHVAMHAPLTGLLKPRKDPKKVRGRDMPSHRHSKARRVVKGMAAEDLAPHNSKFRKKKTPNTIPGMRRAVRRTLDFQRRPPITVSGWDMRLHHADSGGLTLVETSRHIPSHRAKEHIEYL